MTGDAGALLRLGGSEPMDRLAIYLIARLGVGEHLALDTIDRKLRELPLRQSLVLLAEMTFKLERISHPPINAQEQMEFARRVLPERFHPRAEEWLGQPYPPRVVLSSQVLVLLGIRLLSVSEQDRPELEPDQLARRLGALCLALGDHLEAGPLNAESTILEHLRLGLFYGQSQHSAWLSLAGRLFLDVLPLMADHPDWMDPLARFEDRCGISLARFWAITVVQGIAAAQSEDHFQFPLNVRDHPVPREELDAWRGLLASSLPDAMRLAKSDVAQPLGWSMSAVWKRPILELGEGMGPVLRPGLLQMQCEPSQMFWHVRDALVEEGIRHSDWSGLYGAAVERLGKDLLREHADPSILLDEEAFVAAWEIPGGDKRADIAISTPDGDLVVIDFVGRQFTRDTTTTGNFAALEKDLRIGVVEKLEQVDVTLRYALKAGAGQARVFPLVVLAGPFPAIPPLDLPIDQELSNLGVQVLHTHPSCRKWAAMDLVSFLSLLTTSSMTGNSIPDLLDEWQQSGLARNTFRDWALIDGPGKGLPGGGVPNDWQERVLNLLER